MYRPFGRCVFVNRHDRTVDADAVDDGYISITPLTTGVTDERALEKLRNGR